MARWYNTYLNTILCKQDNKYKPRHNIWIHDDDDDDEDVDFDDDDDDDDDDDKLFSKLIY